MKPILFYLGPLPLYSFGLMVAIGVMLSLWLMNRTARRTGFPEGEGSFDMVFASVLSGFLGARIYYIFQNLDWYLENPVHIFALWEGGLIFYGGMISAFLGLWLYLRYKKTPLAKGLDFILPFVSLTHGFGRIGCFLNGCCYGKLCAFPWAVKFPELDHPVHPTQLYEAAFDFMLFLFLRNRYEKKRFEGEVTVLYFSLYAAARFLVEFVRDDNPFWGLFTVNQWISIAIFVPAVLFYAVQFKKSKVPHADA